MDLKSGRHSRVEWEQEVVVRGFGTRTDGSRQTGHIEVREADEDRGTCFESRAVGQPVVHHERYPGSGPLRVGVLSLFACSILVIVSTITKLPWCWSTHLPHTVHSRWMPRIEHGKKDYGSTTSGQYQMDGWRQSSLPDESGPNHPSEPDTLKSALPGCRRSEKRAGACDGKHAPCSRLAAPTYPALAPWECWVEAATFCDRKRSHDVSRHVETPFV